MTCIAGLIEDGNIWIGGDSAAVTHYRMMKRADTKVFINGPFLIGFTSSYRMGQILQYTFVPPEHPEDCDIDKFMKTHFIDAVRSCLKEAGFAIVSDGREEGGTFLVGYRKQLFIVEEDFHVSESIYPFMACGCGLDIALGSLFSTQAIYDPKSRILLSLQAAEEFSSAVRGPFRIMSMMRNGQTKSELVKKMPKIIMKEMKIIGTKAEK